VLLTLGFALDQLCDDTKLAKKIASEKSGIFSCSAAITCLFMGDSQMKSPVICGDLIFAKVFGPLFVILPGRAGAP